MILPLWQRKKKKRRRRKKKRKCPCRPGSADGKALTGLVLDDRIVDSFLFFSFLSFFFFFFLMQQYLFSGKWWSTITPYHFFLLLWLILLTHMYQLLFWGRDVARLVKHRTGTLPTQVRFPGAARFVFLFVLFSPRVTFQCRLSYGVHTPLCGIVCIYMCAR